MTTFDSPLGKRTVGSPKQPMREFVVPDAPQGNINHPPQEQPWVPVNPHYNQSPAIPQPFPEEEIKSAREAKFGAAEHLNQGALHRINLLIGLTRQTRAFQIGEDINTSFAIHSLKSKEMREAIQLASAYDGTTQSPFEIRRQLLARSITHIAGVEISQFLGSNELDARLDFVDELDDALLNRIYNEYLLLTKEIKDKYAVKTEIEAKEVVEDLKK